MTDSSTLSTPQSTQQPTASPKNPLTVDVTEVFQRNAEAPTRFVINEGGTGSSKTFSLCQLFIGLAVEHKDHYTVFSIVRKTLPALKASAMRDFFNILRTMGLYDENCHNKSEHIYHIGKCEIEFFSADDSQKLRSRKRDYLWINEANELSAEDFFQLNIRTSHRVYMDYNPSDVVHWIYEHPSIIVDQTVIRSMFRDNPFCPPAIVNEVQKLEGVDEEYWKIYGQGERAVSKRQIYSNWEECDEIPDYEDQAYGIDFGHTNPTGVIRCVFNERDVWEEELFYAGATNSQLIAWMENHVPKDAEIWADSEAPDRIQEIYEAGWNRIKPCKKGKGSVEYGIGVVKMFKVHVLSSSVNLVREKKAYKWATDKDGNIIEGTPLKFRDHLMDPERYCIVGHTEVGEALEVLFEV